MSGVKDIQKEIKKGEEIPNECFLCYESFKEGEKKANIVKQSCDHFICSTCFFNNLINNGRNQDCCKCKQPSLTIKIINYRAKLLSKSIQDNTKYYLDGYKNNCEELELRLELINEETNRLVEEIHDDYREWFNKSLVLNTKFKIEVKDAKAETLKIKNKLSRIQKQNNWYKSIMIIGAWTMFVFGSIIGKQKGT